MFRVFFYIIHVKCNKISKFFLRFLRFLIYMYQSSYDTLSKGFLEHYYIYHIQIFFNIYLYRL